MRYHARMMNVPPRYVLTGGPCAGKTTLIEELALRGYATVAEAARLVIEEELAAGHTLGHIRSHPDWFQKVVDRVRLLEAELPADHDDPVFLDRGVPDSVAYHRLSGTPIGTMLAAALEEKLYRKIFLLDLVDFERDGARTETPEETERIHALIGEAYRELGYDVLTVPVMPVPARADFILANL